MAAGTVAAGSAKTRTAAAGKYRGRTSQKEPISFKVKSGKVVGKISWKASCGSKGVLAAGTNYKAKLSHGKFKVHGSYKAAIGGTNYTGHFTVTRPGTIHGRKAHGTFSATVGLYRGGSKVGSCHTGKVTWHAHKR